MIKEERY